MLVMSRLPDRRFELAEVGAVLDVEENILARHVVLALGRDPHALVDGNGAVRDEPAALVISVFGANLFAPGDDELAEERAFLRASQSSAEDVVHGDLPATAAALGLTVRRVGRLGEPFELVEFLKGKLEEVGLCLRGVPL